MANQEHLDILERGVEIWNQWRRENPDTQPDLSLVNLKGFFKRSFEGAIIDLSETNLGGVDLSRCILSYANLYGADLREAWLGCTDLSHANLSRANLSGANLILANLSRATLQEANLSGANLKSAVLGEASLAYACLSGANLSGANLSGATLVHTDLKEAVLSWCNIYGVSAWNVQLEGAKQNDLVITPHGEPIITVDNLKIAQFIYLMLNNQELRDVLNAVMERGVLLLGRFSNGGLKMLQAIAAELRKMKYLPIIFDFERPDNRNYTETVKTLVDLARFVIVDLSGPSVPQELYATIPHFKIPFVPIIEEGRKTYAMFADLLEYPWVFPPVTFRDKKQLMKLLPSRIIEPAEKKCQERQTQLDQLFHH